MGSCKIKRNFYTYFKRRKPGHIYNQIKIKPKSNGVNSSGSLGHQGAWVSLLLQPTYLRYTQLVQQLRQTPFHTCHCSWRTAYSLRISKLLRSPLKLRLHLHLWPLLVSSGSDPVTSVCLVMPMTSAFESQKCDQMPVN